MIAKVCTRNGTSKNRSAFGDLAAYIGHQSKALAIERSPSIVALETAAWEMQLVAETSGTHVSHPAYHYVLSWPRSDRVTNDQIFAAARGSLEAIGFDATHQWVAAIHGDSDYQHVHIMVNRIHPETNKAFSPYRDHLKLQIFCRAQEIAHGWTPTNHVNTIDPKTGKLVRLVGATTSLSLRATDSESWTGVMSFQRWVGHEPAQRLRAALDTFPKTWGTVHAALADFDLEYEPTGKGAAVLDRSVKQYRAKASHLGFDFTLPRLESYLGPFRPPYRRQRCDPELTYTANKNAGRLNLPMLLDPHIATLYQRYAALREQWNKSGRAARAAAMAAVRERTKRRRRDLFQQISAVRNDTEAFTFTTDLPRQNLPGTYVAAAITRVLRERTAAINREERMAAITAHRAPPSLFRSWLKIQAAEGDQQAAFALDRIRAGALSLGKPQLLQSIDESYACDLLLGPSYLGRQDSPEIAHLNTLIEAAIAIPTPHIQPHTEVAGYELRGDVLTRLPVGVARDSTEYTRLSKSVMLSDEIRLAYDAVVDARRRAATLSRSTAADTPELHPTVDDGARAVEPVYGSRQRNRSRSARGRDLGR